jgi:hypothetical protein
MCMSVSKGDFHVQVCKGTLQKPVVAQAWVCCRHAVREQTRHLQAGCVAVRLSHPAINTVHFWRRLLEACWLWDAGYADLVTPFALEAPARQQLARLPLSFGGVVCVFRVSILEVGLPPVALWDLHRDL